MKNVDFGLMPRVVNPKLCKVENGNFDQPLEMFQKEASGYLRKICGKDKTLWMQYAQHFGVPTRLLDFSTNPLVALYFACEDECCDGVVWMVNIYNFEHCATFNSKDAFMDEHGNRCPMNLETFYQFVLHIEPEKEVYPAYFVPEYIDIRMNAQSSRFMLWPNHSYDLTDRIKDKNYMNTCPVENGTPPIDQYIAKMVIPRKKKTDILKALDMMGVNRKTLFPGLDSIGDYIKDYFLPVNNPEWNDV